MGNKKVLFIVHSFAPPINAGTIRVFKFAKYLNRYGWKVYVICDGDGVKNNIYNEKNLINELGEKVKVQYVPNIIKKFKNRSRIKYKNEIIDKGSEVDTKESILRKAHNKLEKYMVPDSGLFLWNKAAYKYAVKIIKEKKITNMLTSSPIHSTQLIGLKLKRKFKDNINWIADFRDLWSMSPIFELGLAKFKWLNYILERKVLLAADKIVFVSDSIRNEIIKNFNVNFKTGKLCTITNGFDAEDFQELENHKSNKFKNNMRLKISYIGTILGPRVNNNYIKGIGDFIDNFINKNKDISDISFNFIGEFDKIILNKINNLNTDKIKVVPFVKYKKALEWMRNSDVLVMILTNDKEGTMAFTGKFFEYLLVGKPILALVPEGEVSKIIRKYNLGEVANPDDEQEISNAILRLYKKYKSENLRVKRNKELFKKFDRKELTKRLEQLLDC